MGLSYASPSQQLQRCGPRHQKHLPSPQAEKIMIDSEENKEYLPIQGLEAFCKATADLLLGQEHAAPKVCSSG